MRRTVMFLALCFLAAGNSLAAEKPAASGGSHSLRMEELEVRASGRSPRSSISPFTGESRFPSPVRYDLFLKTWHVRSSHGRSCRKSRVPMESQDKERPVTEEPRKIRVSVVPRPPKTVEETGLSSVSSWNSLARPSISVA